MAHDSRATVIFPPRIVDQLVKLDRMSHAFYPRDLELLAQHWLDRFRTGKLSATEETPLYTEFIPDFFVKTLGYSYGSSDSYRTLRIDKGKSGTRGRPDISLGFFDLPEKLEEVVGVVEIKAYAKGLSNPVHSANHILQTFSYLLGQDAVWGIATNMAEFRLYHRDRANRYQRWTLEDLATNLNAQLSFHACLAAKHLVGGMPGQPGPLVEYFARVGPEQEAITKKFYQQYREIRGACLELLRKHNPQLAPELLIEQTQKLLDRLLFICFAEDQPGLLPQNILKQRLTDNFRLVEQPRLSNLRELFRGIDQGWQISELKQIPAYNGGLFRFDPLLDRDLKLTEQVAQWALKLADWDYYSVVGFDLLGHVFEQSITDLEQLRSEARGEIAAKRDSKRKREGVFYTPDYVTEYIVRQTIGRKVQDLQQTSLTRLELADDVIRGDESPVVREALRQHLLNWRDAIVRLRILDPACGSGAFLLAAYGYLKDTLDRIQFKLLELVPESEAELALFSPEDHLLSRCLFGVDLNTESVEITKLSLWIATARADQKLHMLDRNIYMGNSLIADHRVDPRAFDWGDLARYIRQTSMETDGAAPEDEGSPAVFDCVIGNPPYVRQERISAYKEYLEGHYGCYDAIADLYTYFYELGLRLLKPGGRLGFISGGSFFRGGFGTPLRRLLREQAAVEEILNFGDYRVFPDAEMVDPSILILRKSATTDAPDPPTRVWVNHNKQALPKGGIADILERAGFAVPEESLADAQWQLANPIHRELLGTILGRGTKLKDIAGSKIHRGVTTGLNRTERVTGEGVFVIDRSTRDRLVTEDFRSAEVLKPLLEGKDLKAWHLAPQDRWLVFTRRGIDINQYPAIKRHLERFRDRLEPKPDEWKPEKLGEKWGGRKGGDYTWYEIQDSVAYYESFEKPKIMWAEIAKVPRFNFDRSGFYFTNKAHMTELASQFLLGVLNSRAVWFQITNMNQPLGQRAGLWRFQLVSESIERIHIPTPAPADERIIAAAAEELSALGARKYARIQEVRHRLLTDFILPYAPQTSRSQKLAAWHTLDFTLLRTEIEKRAKRKVPLKDRTELEGYLATERREVLDLAAHMTRLEDTLNAAVNRAFDLTEEECAIVNRVLDPVGVDEVETDEADAE